jgi:hypothetical protein
MNDVEEVYLDNDVLRRSRDLEEERVEDGQNLMYDLDRGDKDKRQEP